MVRTLQRVDVSRRGEVAQSPDLQRLLAVATSPHLACGFVHRGVLPVARDALAIALHATPDSEWNVPTCSRQRRARQSAQRRARGASEPCGRPRKSRYPWPQPDFMTKTNGACWAATGALCVVALALLWPVLSYESVGLDDASLLSEFSGADLARIWARDHFGHLRPVKNVLFWLVARDAELLPSIRVLVLAAAAGSALMLQLLATQVLGSRWWGLLAAACWLLNPTTASVAAWLAASNYVLALFFALAYVLLAGRSPLGDAWADRLVMVAAHVALLLAALSHELCLLAPLLLLVTRSPGVRFPSLQRRTAVLTLAAAVPVSAVVLLQALGRGVDVAYRTATHSNVVLFLSSARYAFSNLRLWYWQRGAFGVLLTDEPGEQGRLSALAWLALAAVVAALAWVWRRDPASRLGIAWVAAFLLPLVNLVPLGNTPIAVHYLYLSGPGLALLLSRAAQRCVDRLSVVPRLRALPAAVVVLLVVLWLPEFQSSVSAWSDTAQLYGATLKNHPANVEARANLVSAYLEQGQLGRADELLVESLRIAPNDPALVGNRFELLWRMERWADALALLDAHDTLRGDDYLYRRGRILEALGRPLEALAPYAVVSAKATEPELRFAAGYQRATILVNAGRLAEAKQQIERMLKEFPDDPRLQLTYRVMTEQLDGAE